MPRRAPVAKEQHSNAIHIPGAYGLALLEWCRHEVTDPMAWLTASGDAASFAEYERETGVLADLLFDERFGEPLEAWWYWLPPLPRQWQGPAAPRRFCVVPGDLVEPFTDETERQMTAVGLSNFISGKKPPTPPTEPLRRSERRADAPTFTSEHAERDRRVSGLPVSRPAPEPTAAPTRERPYVDDISDHDSGG